ncbi:OLC1v1025465C2 [Oldenlandia corymbosa var. corymbosa]|nr:OLC1v1025465C2 [Oldenlandia corymbosa var. corymbosa]
MTMVITAYSGDAAAGEQHPYVDCFTKCSPSCFTPMVNHKCLINCDLKCHGSATGQFLGQCKSICEQVYCSRVKHALKKRICDTTCATVCHAK